MIDEPSFIRAIIASPDDDGLRLAFSDWLQEDGQSERAEFIQIQIELESIPVHKELSGYLESSLCSCEWCVRKMRVDYILRRRGFGQIWAGRPLSNISECYFNYNRGFINRIDRIIWSEFNRHADTLLTQHPIKKVKLSTMPIFARGEEAALGYGRLEGRTKVHWTFRVIGERDMRHPAIKLLTQEWPGVDFEVEGITSGWPSMTEIHTTVQSGEFLTPIPDFPLPSGMLLSWRRSE